ncbi:hypothetical protein D3C81_1082430 [compost metagenome]
MFAYWGAITFNRNTRNSLGLYDLLRGPGWDAVFWVCFCGAPVLTIALIIRLAQRNRFAFFEVPLAIVVCILFLYNFSFFRS